MALSQNARGGISCTLHSPGTLGEPVEGTVTDWHFCNVIWNESFAEINNKPRSRFPRSLAKRLEHPAMFVTAESSKHVREDCLDQFTITNCSVNEP